MEDEVVIDIRRYVKLLLQKWIWIVAAAAVLGVIAGVLSYLTPASYDATAMVAIAKPQYVLNFDPTIQTQNIQISNYGAYLDLATSPDVLNEVYRQVTSRYPDIASFEDLTNRLSVTKGSDPSILVFTAKAKTAQEAADLVNLWAQTYVVQANNVFGGSSQVQIEAFQTQLADAERNRDQSLQALSDFQAKNTRTILQNQLDSIAAQQSSYLNRISNLNALQQDMQAFQSELQTGRLDSATIAAQLSLFDFQLKTFNDSTLYRDKGSNAPASIQVQITGQDQISLTAKADQIAYLSNLTAVAEKQKSEFLASANQLDAQILDLQQQIQVLQGEEDLRKADYANTQDAYTALYRKVSEVKISATDGLSSIKMASGAVIPERPASKHTSRNAGIGIVLGGFLSILGILLMDWWKSSAE